MLYNWNNKKVPNPPLVQLIFFHIFWLIKHKKYIDGSKPCPPSTITQNNTTVPNPAHNTWIRQDQLILNALVGYLSPTIIPFIARAKTSAEAWLILANTYAKPSRGRIKQVKNQIKNLTKGSQIVTEFLQLVKCRADELAILGAPMNEDDRQNS